jgi:hypothetical protein
LMKIEPENGGMMAQSGKPQAMKSYIDHLTLGTRPKPLADNGFSYQTWCPYWCLSRVQNPTKCYSSVERIEACKPVNKKGFSFPCRVAKSP